MATGGSDDKQPTIKESLGLGMRFVISTISSKFPTVKNVATPDLAKWLRSEDRDVVVLDCRDPREYEVSHVPQAVRVEWKTEDIPKLMESVAEREGPANKTVVCYCSLGYRGCAMAQKIQEYNTTAENPVKQLEVYNLAGSLFKWANEGRPLLDSDGKKTVMAHPYTPMWGMLLNSEFRKW